MILKKALKHRTYKKKNNLFIIWVISLFLLFLAPSGTRAYENPLFSKTHLLPSPYTYPQGTFIYGTYLAYGLTNFLQIGTNLLKNFNQIYNADAKVSLVDSHEFANALTLSIDYTNLNNLSPKNKDISVLTYRPGTVCAIGIDEQLVWFIGGHIRLSSLSVNSNDLVESSGFYQGSVFQSDLTFMYNPMKTKKSGETEIGNAISAGFSYDLLYSIVGIGLSHHWSSFQLGFHYYLNADQDKLLPILAGGGSIRF